MVQPASSTLDEFVESALLTSNAAIPQLSRRLMRYRSEWAWRLRDPMTRVFAGSTTLGKAQQSITRTFAGRLRTGS